MAMESTNERVMSPESSSSGNEIGAKCVQRLARLLQEMKKSQGSAGKLQLLSEINSLIRDSKLIYGEEISDCLRANGGLDHLLTNWDNDEEWLPTLNIIEECLSRENLDYVVKNALNSTATMTIRCIEAKDSVESKRVCTKILTNLLQHSDEACNTVVELGGLQAIWLACRTNDEETLGNCAQGFTNASLFGGDAIFAHMLEERGYMWIFPLVFHSNLDIKYHACLAVAKFRSDNRAAEIIARSGALAIFEDITTNHDPCQLADTHKELSHCHNVAWLRRFVSVLASNEEDSRNLAAFHFCLEATVLERRGLLSVIREIGAVEHLEKIARSQCDIGSYYATQVLVMIGENIEEVPV